MGRIRSYSVVVVFVTFFLILFSALHLDILYSQRTEPQSSLSHLNHQVRDSDVKTQYSKLRGVNHPLPRIYNVSVSDGFRQTVLQNQAYWNRLLYLSLRNLDETKSPLSLESQWSHCRETNQELLQTNMHDFNSYPVLFKEFVRSMNCMSSPLLINQPNKCISTEGNGANQTFLLLAIKSVPGNFARRQAVRETWGQELVDHRGLRVLRVFLLGRSQVEDPDLSPLLSFEAKHFGDLLQWDFQESFLNLTLKMDMFIQWSLQHCPRISYVFSGDDDVFLNTQALLSYLLTLKDSKASQLYAGHIIKTANPLRDPNIKYYVPLSFYAGPYPAYAGGGGFLISGQLLQPLHSVMRVIPFFPIDDVYIGMCMKALEVSPEVHAGFQTFDIKREDRENLCVHKKLILVHQRSPLQIKKLWNGIHSPLLTC